MDAGDVAKAAPKAVLSHLRALRSSSSSSSAEWASFIGTVRTLRQLLTRPEPRVRVAALRTLRHLCAASPAAWRAAWCEYLELYLVASMDGRDGPHEVRQHLEQERLEALKLFALLVRREPGSLTAAQLASAVALAEAQDDPMHGCGIEVLREVAVADSALLCQATPTGGDATSADATAPPDTSRGGAGMLVEPPPAFGGASRAASGGAFHGDGLGALIHGIVREDDGGIGAAPHVAISVALSLAHLLDAPASRARIHPSDLRLLLSPLTELEIETEGAPPSVSQERLLTMRACAAAIISLCGTWPGLITLGGDRYGLRAMLASLLVPPLERGQLIIDILFTIFGFPHLVADPTRDRPASSGRALSNESKSGAALLGPWRMGHGGAWPANAPSLRRHASLTTLWVMMECGLVDVFTAAAAANPALAPRLAALQRELLVLTAEDDVLPPALRLRLHHQAAITKRAISIRPTPFHTTDTPSLSLAYAAAVAAASGDGSARETRTDAPGVDVATAVPMPYANAADEAYALSDTLHATALAPGHMTLAEHATQFGTSLGTALSGPPATRVIPAAKAEALISDLLADFAVGVGTGGARADPSLASTQSKRGRSQTMLSSASSFSTASEHGKSSGALPARDWPPPPARSTVVSSAHSPTTAALSPEVAEAWPREWEASGLLAQLRAAGALETEGLAAVARGRVDAVRLEEAHAADEAEWQKQIRESGVLSSKYYLRDWDWSRIESLVDGPLRFDAKLDRALRTAPKWFKRQLSMLRPEKDCFAQERQEDVTSPVLARVSAKLLNLLLSSDDGADFLGSHLISQLATAVRAYLQANGMSVADAPGESAHAAEGAPSQSRPALMKQPSGRLLRRVTGDGGVHDSDEDDEPSSPLPGELSGRRSADEGVMAATGALGALPQGPSPHYTPERLLSETSIQRQMVREYFTFIGLLSAHTRGRRLLARVSFWPLLEALCRMPNRLDLAQLTMHSLSYATIPPAATIVPAGERNGALPADADTRGAATGANGTNGHAPSGDDASGARHVLALCCEAAMPDVRLAATRVLSVLVTAHMDGFGEWGLELLRNATFDADVRVRQEALGALLRASALPDLLPRLVSMVGHGALTLELICRDAPLHEALAPLPPAGLSATRGALPTSLEEEPHSEPPSPTRLSRRSTSTRTSLVPPPLPWEDGETGAGGAAGEAAAKAAAATAASAPTSPATKAPTRHATTSPLAPLQPWHLSVSYILLLRLASHADGLEALVRSGWLARELSQWRVRSPQPESGGDVSGIFAAGGKAEAYTLGIEACAALAVHATDEGGGAGSRSDVIDRMTAAATESDGDGTVATGAHNLMHSANMAAGAPLPPHLFAALAATAKGRAALDSAGIFPAHLALISTSGPAAGGVAQRAALWAVGQVGSTEDGFEWLMSKSPDAIPLINSLARTAPYLSLRGTAIAVLGLLGGSGAAARTKLSACGWNCPEVAGAYMALPAAGTTFLGSLGGDTWGDETEAARAAEATEEAAKDIAARMTSLESYAEGDAALEAIIRQMTDLANSVRAGEAVGRIKEMREATPELFAHRGLFLAAHTLLTRYRVPLAMRRQIHMLVARAGAAFEAPAGRRELLEKLEPPAAMFGRARGASFVGARVSVVL